MQTNEEFLAEWQERLASAQRQLGYFESGRMRWKVNGVDRSDHHVASLKRVIESIEKCWKCIAENPGFVKEKSMKMSDGEKLIAVMLADLMEANGVNSEINPAFVKEAIFGGDLWSLKWQYSSIFHGEEPSDATVKETADILTMCSILEYSIAQLSSGERATIPNHQQTVFIGFDGNNEDHFGVAKMMIEHMGRWSEFHGRELNSHMQVLGRYRRMWAAYDANGGAANSPLPLGEITSIINA